MCRTPATVDAVFESLRSLYWSSTTTEVANLVLAHREIIHHQNEPSSYETQNSALGGQHFEMFCSNWAYTSDESPLDIPSVHRRALEIAESRYLFQDVHYKRARSLLKALGILDIDHLHLSMGSSLIGREHHPQSEVLRTGGQQSLNLFRQMICSHCSSSIRGYFWYECEKGCMIESANVHFECADSLDLKLEDLSEETRKGLLKSPVRSCAHCIEVDDWHPVCQPDHLRKRFGNKTKEKGQLRFESRLRDHEIRDKGFESLTWRLANVFINSAQYANAGPIHFGVMFGPIIIQNGIPDTSSGALVSRRPMLNLCFKPQQSLLYGFDDNPMEGTELRIYDDRRSSERTIHQVSIPERSIQFLGCVKKVYGGAFCGHTDVFRDKEQRIVDCFIKEAASYRYLPSKDVTENARRLRQHSTAIVEQIRTVFETEINSYLRKFAETLSDKDTPLRWDLKVNNCQGFAEKLLGNLDTKLLFHKVPRNYFSNDAVKFKEPWPCQRYLLSFGQYIDTPIAFLRPQVKSLVWRYYHAKRDYCDMIEYAEQFRTKLSAFSTNTWEVLCDEDVVLGQDPNMIGGHSSTLTDALWTLPRDTLSIIQTHLMRDRSRYTDTEGRQLDQRHWIINRLRILHQSDLFSCLCSSLLSALLEEASKKPDKVLLRYCFPTAEMHGVLHVKERMVHVPYLDVMFLTGRERDWWKRETAHEWRKLKQVMRRNRSKDRDNQQCQGNWDTNC